MKTLFEIMPGDLEPGSCNLTCELAGDLFCFTLENEEQHLFSGVALYQFEQEDPDPVAALEALLERQPLLKNRFARTCIVFSGPESVLIPFSLYSSLENSNVLNLVHGDLTNNDLVQTDLVSEAGVYNAYRIPRQLDVFLAKNFPGAEKTHLYSSLLKGQQPENILLVILYPERFTVLLRAENRTRLIQTYTYAGVTDVSYTLLNLSRTFGVPDIPVTISGLVDRDSALYKEIYQYFTSVTLAALPDHYQYSDAIREHPAHYFSHVFALASCG